MRRHSPEVSLTRRQALGVLGAAGGAYLVARGSGERWLTHERPGVGVASAATSALADEGTISCVLTPAETEGPYFVDERLARSDITVDPSDGSVSAGVPLRLRINVYRVDDGCAPEAGAYVDVWHADAAGTYSDVAQIGTTGRKFLRGYQITDASGAVEFTTIYPGWYPGRTIHIHFKVRIFAGSEKTYEFTSQLYFDETVNDQVIAVAPYNLRGARDTTNGEDAIFTGGSSLLLTLVADGSGGWVGTFGVGLSGLPAASGGCTELATCRSALDAALPDPSTASDRKSRRAAQRLGQLGKKAGRALDRAAAASGARQARELGKARKALEKLLTKAQAANAQGTLGVPLAQLQEALSGLLALLPAA